IYKTIAEEYMAMPVLVGRKTEREKFAGAVITYSIEAMMGDKKALQSGTSHYLGQNFAKAFDVRFQNEQNTMEYVYATSWGVSTRLVGAVVMSHGDDKGLILPPKIAPYQVVIVPIWRNDEQKSEVLSYCDKLAASLREKGIRLHLDLRDTISPGFKFNDWEMKGVPLRIEAGPKDIEKNQVVLVRRLGGKKEFLSISEFLKSVAERLDDIQKELLQRQKKLLKENTFDVASYDELKDVLEKGGFARCFWAGTGDDEERIKEETKGTVRVKLFEKTAESGICILTGKESQDQVIFAKAY
ncbi:MAG TPA: proline--tRNA ligase, partial [Candidatus Marinimicrobia bacterium]|nr:proline--tRNA ligase [Candidatus Neomarinimicrobiota bacterium]